MGFDSDFLPVPEIAYKSDLYNDAEDAVVTWLDSDSYLRAEYDSTTGAVRDNAGDGGIAKIWARPITMNDAETLFGLLTQDDLPAILVDAQSKFEDSTECGAGVWEVPIQVLIAVVSTAMDIGVLDNNTKRRLGEVERCMRQLAGSNGPVAVSTDFWATASVDPVGPAAVMIGQRDDNAFQGVGWLQVTIRRRVENRQEAL